LTEFADKTLIQIEQFMCQ